MARIAVIANPVASQFTGGAHRDVMAALSASHDTEAMWPSSAGEAAEMSRGAAAEGFDVVVAMGGDGMVHHVAQGVVGSPTALGIIPAGTTNVVARLLRVPSRHTKAARLVAGMPTTRSIGVATITIAHGAVDTIHHAIFACGVGLDAEVVAKADQDPYRKYRFGAIHYMRTAIGVAMGKFSSRKPHVAVTADGHETMASTVLTQFREVYTYFGAIPLRLAKGHPDPMTVLTFDRVRRTRVPQIGFDAIAGRDLRKIKGAEVWEHVSEIALRADPPMAIQADGEGLGVAESATIVWNPRALRVIAGPTAG
ncbi:MAG TPA: diacylglycerol kinase family protein [Acidimicrobiia bacterium]